MKERIAFQQLPEPLVTNMMAIEHYLGKQELDRQLLELVRYYVSQLNGCAYCMDMHFKEAVAAGEAVHRLHSVVVWQQTDYYTDVERAVLEWAEELTLTTGSTPSIQGAFEALKPFYSDQQIANLTLAVSQINAWNRLSKAFGFVPGSYRPQ